MANFRYQLLFLALFTGVQSVSAGILSSFRFSKLLYSCHFCTSPGTFCPAPPCDLSSFNNKLCEHYVCSGGGPHKTCTFIGNCNGDTDCIAAAQHNGFDEDYFADEEFTADSNTPDYSSGYGQTDYSGTYHGSYNERTGAGGQIATASRSWLAYGVLGGTLVAFMMYVVWRKRSIQNEDLVIELEPHGQDLNGAVARHHAQQSQAAMV